MNIRRLGFYRELEYGSLRGPSIEDRTALDWTTKQRVLNYLESAPTFVASASMATDYFTGEIIGTQEMQTDGQWVWFRELAHYVRQYDTVLDLDFIDHVAGSDQIALSPEQLLEVINSLDQLASC